MTDLIVDGIATCSTVLNEKSNSRGPQGIYKHKKVPLVRLYGLKTQF